jgi:nicotinamide N-methyltransferase
VFYTHHRPHLAARDLAFFERARARGWACEEVLTRRFAPMFADDPGAEEVRATVHGWRMTR